MPTGDSKSYNPPDCYSFQQNVRLFYFTLFYFLSFLFKCALNIEQPAMLTFEVSLVGFILLPTDTMVYFMPLYFKQYCNSKMLSWQFQLFCILDIILWYDSSPISMFNCEVYQMVFQFTSGEPQESHFSSLNQKTICSMKTNCFLKCDLVWIPAPTERHT